MSKRAEVTRIGRKVAKDVMVWAAGSGNAFWMVSWDDSPKAKIGAAVEAFKAAGWGVRVTGFGEVVEVWS